ncbi:MAG: metal-dependent hydrolase [Opitutales bacterium]|nr:metal-dependent hydrolase [Opitutales bacterium]
MQITYLGHSALQIDNEEHTLLVDPFLSGNEACPVKPEEVQCDYILLTHGHDDHIGDTEQIAKANEATIVANFEIADFFGGKGLKTHGMYIGGAYEFPFGRLKFTIAHHGSSLGTENGRIAMGNPAGHLLQMNGKVIYNAGDTGLFLDMKLIGEMNPIDVAILPIGDNFTMGVEDALKALEFLKPKTVIPVHYNTWPLIEVDSAHFAKEAEKLGVQAVILQPGDDLEL